MPRGLLTRRQGGSRRSRTVPLVRLPRTLPRILSPGEADRLAGALRTHRDQAMVLAMLLAGLRRCEVLGLRFADVQVADRRLAVTEGKGGRHRIVPVANRFFGALGAYLHDERPAAPTDRVFVVMKGPRRGLPLSAEGLDEILSGGRHRPIEHRSAHSVRPHRYPLPAELCGTRRDFSRRDHGTWASRSGIVDLDGRGAQVGQRSPGRDLAEPRCSSRAASVGHVMREGAYSLCP
jgi:integrase